MYAKLPTMLYIGHVWIGHCASTTINAQKSDKEGEEAEMWLQAMNSLVLQNKLMVKSSVNVTLCLPSLFIILSMQRFASMQQYGCMHVTNVQINKQMYVYDCN